MGHKTYVIYKSYKFLKYSAGKAQNIKYVQLKLFELNIFQKNVLIHNPVYILPVVHIGICTCQIKKLNKLSTFQEVFC